MNSPPIIDIKSLHVKGGAKTLLFDIDLVVRQHERVAIIGANGAGKTTLLKVLTGMIAPASGTVTVLGQNVAKQILPSQLRTLRAQIGQVFQGLHLVGRLNALENVLIGALGRNRSMFTCARIFPAEEHERAHAALRAVGMLHAAKHRVDRLSGGERQKVAVARALNQNPTLILADEPTANLDPVAASEIADLLSQIAEDRKATLVTVAHSMALLPNLAQRIIGLSSGRMVFDQPINTVDKDQLALLYPRSITKNQVATPTT